MKKLAYCLVLLGLGTMVFAGCAKEEKKPVTKPAVGGTEKADEGATDTPAPDTTETDEAAPKTE